MEYGRKKIYVVGHRNPDTDSICSAIAYANLKQKLSGSEQYVAKRLGLLNAETEYVLERFGVEEPSLLSNVKLKVMDVDINQIDGIPADTSIKDAWAIMKQQNVFTLAVTASDRLEGVISIGDIAMSYMDVYDSHILATARTRYSSIVKTLDGEIVTGDGERVIQQGKVVVAASSPDMMEATIQAGDVVLLGNRYEVQLCAIELEAGCIIVCQDCQVTKTIRKLAEERGVIIIRTPHDAYTACRLINQSIPVEYFMKKDGIKTFRTTDLVEDIKADVIKDRTRDFPVVDRRDHFCGFVSSRRLMDARKRQMILVDHNEQSHAVEGIEEAEILEIIDHHRLGGLETMGPVYFRNQPVGCTATIIYTMYQENAVALDTTTAALLCSAIISDTLLFRSPTCTALDEQVARRLAEIAGIDPVELAHGMFRAGSDLRDKTAEEICFQDFKKFTVGDVAFAVGQINSMNPGELEQIRGTLQPYLEEAARQHHLDMMFFMLTDILGESTELLCWGRGARERVIEAFDLPRDAEQLHLPGVVSRKKQFIPAFVVSLQN